jgi:hypothetical protein
MDEAIREQLLSRKPGKVIVEALGELIEKDGYLLKVDANERSIVHRFALHLQKRLPEWHVDCEYNRDGVDPKHIEYHPLTPDAEDTEAKTVYPDVIVHLRGTKNNYLVIELKKSTNSVSRKVDIAKLRGYKQDLGYGFALFLKLRAGERPGVSSADWIDT